MKPEEDILSGVTDIIIEICSVVLDKYLNIGIRDKIDLWKILINNYTLNPENNDPLSKEKAQTLSCLLNFRNKVAHRDMKMNAKQRSNVYLYVHYLFYYFFIFDSQLQQKCIDWIRNNGSKIKVQHKRELDLMNFSYPEDI